ncbi:hypothetical protein [Stenotrophomonas sp. AB1(2024)]|uniref:hypothetical protein n=1 Tax=Stenotrophomonas sp. AB1(2024) TaxID=3132215 RepID=UPI00309B6877
MQLLLFPENPAADVEALIRGILALRRRHGASGQAGEDIDLIRAALTKETA